MHGMAGVCRRNDPPAVGKSERLVWERGEVESVRLAAGVRAAKRRAVHRAKLNLGADRSTDRGTDRNRNEREHHGKP